MTCQKYIYKIHSSRLRKSKWKLILPINEARRNDEVISLADSQILRWIDELNGVEDGEYWVSSIRSQIRSIRKQDNSPQNRREIKRLYSELDEIQYKPDYMCLIIDKKSDYYRACKGFSINGIKYVRLLGTNGGIKNSTIVFVSEGLAPELKRRIENGRNPDIPLVTAKLEAYKALTCSASLPVSTPNGVLVVNDCETEFAEDVVYLSNSGDGEPLMQDIKGYKVKLDASDGFGLMLPKLAERWSEDLDLDYMIGGGTLRYAFTKGMVFPFDFVDFAEKVANENYIVKDAWGDEVDVRNIELVLTTSMVKLWDSYKNCEEFLRISSENGYTFGITKVCPKELENERNLNYQFIQSYELDDDDIEELVTPTIKDIHAALGDDWRKTILYLKGLGLNEHNVLDLPDDFIKAIMVDDRMVNDPYAQSTIFQMIKNRINEAKVGVLKVHGNFSIASGDPYALCQSFFNLSVTGLLNGGEIYNKYWSDAGSDKVVCFRAPMTCHNNIRALTPISRDDAKYWFRYMSTCTIFNAWDTCMAALNGMDFDGDLVMLTDNPVLVRKHVQLPALICEQRKAPKTISTEDDFVQSNISSFGNDIGKTTNWVTSMYEVRARYPKGSKEYNTLSYRIRAGQQLQQDAIDKAKGIICKSMPRTWHDKYAVNNIDDEQLKGLYRSILADKKPYFMRYIYPALQRQYTTFVKNTNKTALRNFQLTVEELQSEPYKELSDEQKTFLHYFDVFMPVGMSDCVMNKICRRIESEFDGYISKNKTEHKFNHKIMQGDCTYTNSQFYAIKQLYEKYAQRMYGVAVFALYERIDDSDIFAEKQNIADWFVRECEAVCPNYLDLCDIAVELCYTSGKAKDFAWTFCGDAIISNLLKGNGGYISFPTMDSNGDIEFAGNKFSMKTIQIGG